MTDKNKEELEEVIEPEAGAGASEPKEDCAEAQVLINEEVALLTDRLLRLQADFDNYRKRNLKEREEWYKYAAQGVLSNLLPVIDNLERALASLDQQNEEIKNLFAGFQMIYRQMLEALGKEGLEVIPALGEDFNPIWHEAIMQVPAEAGQQDNQIVEELRKGYRLKDKILRPAMVKVAKG